MPSFRLHPQPGIKPRSAALQAHSLPAEQPVKLFSQYVCVCVSCLVVFDSLQPHRLQPTRPLCPWGSPAKNTGVGCHFLLQKELQKERKGSRSVVSDSLRPHGLQPARLLHPWNFPGKSTGVGCHFFLQFSYDLNQIPYDYTMEVKNRFKGLDLIDRVTDELWTEVHDIVQEAAIKTMPKKKKCKKAKWLSEEALQIAEKRKNIPFQVGRFLLLLSFCC